MTRWLRSIWIWLFGKDEYLDGEHIAHEPSLLDRLKVRRSIPKLEVIIQVDIASVLARRQETDLWLKKSQKDERISHE